MRTIVMVTLRAKKDQNVQSNITARENISISLTQSEGFLFRTISMTLLLICLGVSNKDFRKPPKATFQNINLFLIIRELMEGVIYNSMGK